MRSVYRMEVFDLWKHDRRPDVARNSASQWVKVRKDIRRSGQDDALQIDRRARHELSSEYLYCLNGTRRNFGWLLVTDFDGQPFADESFGPNPVPVLARWID